MPLYLRKQGLEAEKEKKKAIEREKDRAAKRVLLNSGHNADLKRKALAEMTNLREVRRGVKQPPVPPGEGYSDPTYDPTTRCWKSYAERDGDWDQSQWQAWCVDSQEWLSSDEYERAHPPDELANIHDENEDEAFGGPAPVPGNIKRRTTMDSMKALARRLPGIGNFGGRSTLRSQKVC